MKIIPDSIAAIKIDKITQEWYNQIHTKFSTSKEKADKYN